MQNEGKYTMKIQVNGMIYDESNRDCQCHLADAQHEVFAFIQCLDVGMDGTASAIKKRYWGRYDHDNKEASIRAIMENGGKWPVLPK